MSQFSSPDLSGERVGGSHSSKHLLEWSLRPWGRALLFLIPIVAFSLVLAWETIRVAWVTYRIDDISIPVIQQALQTDPDNADVLHRLGSIYNSDPNETNQAEAEKYLRRAVEINPRRWDYWLDLGAACDFGGDTACSDDAFEHAASLNPMTPTILWAVGNHYLLTNRPDKAFAHFRRLVELDPEYMENTFHLCFRATRDPQAIYSEVVPNGQDASPRFAFLLFLCSTADYENAMKIWGQMIAGPDKSPDMALVKPFLDFLLDHNQIDDAETVWVDLQHAGDIPAEPSGQAANLLYNGGFEVPPLNTGFDWRISDSSDLEYDLADPNGYQGGKCLRFDFVVGRNAEYDLADQIVRIKPNTRYQLSADVRTNNITSDTGPRLRSIEMGCATCAVPTSEQVIGTTPWHSIDLEFMTQPQTQAVRISFWRPQEHSYSRDITGTVWLDNVILHAVDAPAHDLNQARIR